MRIRKILIKRGNVPNRQQHEPPPYAPANKKSRPRHHSPPFPTPNLSLVSSFHVSHGGARSSRPPPLSSIYSGIDPVGARRSVPLLSIACKSGAKAICGSLTLLQLWSWEQLHVGRPDIAMHLLAQDMSLGHRSEFDHQEDYQVRWEPYTADILEMLPAVSRQASHLWLSRVPLISFSIVEMHVPDRVLRQFGRVQHILGPVDALDRVTRKGRGHIDWARYFAHFVQM
ncbi:hypothetical protein Taro_005188 [Colocasia esculenta]|uniref:Aminotransferase-like plant mobile domain-containing protein n=1 Tax=Colocasia esculenta TaxID=4460 RepID=A0A843TMD4_COLES|nr:hypothetical protein [Colocasia esculenta]